MKLIYVNALGPNYKGDNVYEFIFSDINEVWGDEWDSQPAHGNPSPPLIQFIKKVGVLRNSGIRLNMIQDSDFFGMYDAVDDVIALAWEDDDTEAIIDNNLSRLVFRYGESIKSVDDKLYERDVVLKYEKQLVDHE